MTNENAFQSRKLSKKWSAKYKRELDEKLNLELRDAKDADGGEGYSNKCAKKKRSFFSKNKSKNKLKVNENVDNQILQKSPTGRLTKYFSGKVFVSFYRIESIFDVGMNMCQTFKLF